MFLFDTNVFLEILLGQQQSAKALAAIEAMTDRNRGAVTAFSIHAIEAILSSRKRLAELDTFLDFLETHPYLDRYSTSTQDERAIAKTALGLKLDFDDALQFWVAKSNRLTLVTFDNDFLKTKGIKLLLL